ncbi:MAG: transglycosylase domain-containing protein, partial [Spirochaetes bacterium]|nr:transglycosylase domain-containing protein [Spirochaetota bacterium]
MQLKKILTLLLITILIILFINFILWILPYPELKQFLEKPYSLNIYDRNEMPLYTLPLKDGTRREYIELDEIPGLVKKIFIKSEDKRFYYHCGIDFVAIIRTIFLNIKQKKIITGASTITMQLSRIISPNKKGYKGKIKEMINAIRLEAKLSKNKILELWLNSIPYGYKTIGIKTASKTFFAKNLEELTHEQVIVLSIIPRSPSKYNPFDNSQQLKKTVLNLCKRLNFNTSIKQINISLDETKSYQWEFETPHFINFIKKGLSNKDLAKGKLIISSIDLDLNKKINGLLNQYLNDFEDNRITNGAILAINNNTGEIIIYIGSRDFLNKKYSGQIDGIRIFNQPGSTIKPFLYALALENNFLPSTILPDIPFDFGDEDVYVPLNFNRRFNGPVRLRVALASSLNVPSVYLVTRLGVRNFVDKLLELGFDSIIGHEENIGSGIALGNSENSLFELVKAFSV